MLRSASDPAVKAALFNTFSSTVYALNAISSGDLNDDVVHPNLCMKISTTQEEVEDIKNCELENCGEDEPVTKRNRLSDGATTKQQKRTPLLERNQNLGTAEVKSVSAQNQKKAIKAREESSIKAMQQMHTSMAVSKNFLSSFLSTMQS